MSDAWVAGEYRVRYLDREGVEHVEVVEVRPYATTDGWAAWCEGWPAFSGRDAAHALRHAVGFGGRELFVLEIIAPDAPSRAELCAQVAKMERERDEARAEVARITALLDTTEHHAAAQELDLHSLRGDYSALVAEVERLRAEHEAPGLLWYAYDAECGYETYRTAAEAKAAAEASIESARDEDHWPEEVEYIEWGRLIPYERATQTEYVAAKDDESGRCERDGLSHLCNYELADARARGAGGVA